MVPPFRLYGKRIKPWDRLGPGCGEVYCSFVQFSRKSHAKQKLEDLDNRPPLPSWTLVTSHGLVLLYVATHRNATIRQTAEHLELTERRIADIIRDLERSGLMTVERIGRRNRYSLDPDARFRHPYVSNIRFMAFLDLWEKASEWRSTASD